MQGIKLLSAFGGIDEKYVLEAGQPFPKRSAYSARRWVGMAAAVCLALGLTFTAKSIVKDRGIPKGKTGEELIYSKKDTNPGRGRNPKELKKIDPSGNFSGDLGTGCLTAKKASDLINNPAGASEEISTIQTMPVYQRKERAYEYGLMFLSETEMEEGEEYLSEVAGRLHWNMTGIEREINVQAEGTQVVSLLAECRQGSMELDAEGTLYVCGLKCVPKKGQDTEGFVSETMQRLQCISGFSKTKTFVWQNYDYNGEKTCEYYGYEEDGSRKEQIQNCALSRLHCYVEEDGTIDSFRLYHYRANAVCLGEYPIINRQKAEKLLFQGKYMSQYSESLPADARVAVCELSYVPSINSQVLLPYYSFLVEVPGRQEDEKLGLKTFARFYVPAVKEKYFKDSFDWELAVD